MMPSHPQLLPKVLILVLAAAALAAAGDAGQEEQRPVTLAGCPDKCGDISIPFPFGTKAGCFLPGFEVTCNTSSNPPRAFLAYNDLLTDINKDIIDGGAYQQNIVAVRVESVSGRDIKRRLLALVELMDISVGKNEARAYSAVASDCSVSSIQHSEKFQLTQLGGKGPFLLSATRNVLVGVGCKVAPIIVSFVMTSTSSGEDFSIACTSDLNGKLELAKDESCSNLGCCQTTLPEAHPLTAFGVSFSLQSTNSPLWETNPCSYAMLVERSRYVFSTTDLYGTESKPVLPDKFPRGAPLVLEFAIRNAGECPPKGQPPPQGYACLSANSYCDNAASGKGYVCKCADNYDGNPYIPDGCQDIDECELRAQSPQFRDLYPCSTNGICRNKQGGYDCACKPGMKGDGKAGTCAEKFPLVAKAFVGTSLGVFSLVVAVLVALIMIQKRRLQEYFEKNGGDKLKNVNGLIIFTKKELKKITNNNSEFIGKGSFGEVYKGTLSDNTIVAVKSSIEVTIDTLKEFTKEVEIQTKMIHPNILKLLGCCLEVDVPMLVYEFAAKGSLHGIIHGNNKEKLPLNLRMDIAIGAAEGLKYMHSCAHQGIPIRHGDVKPDNILLDDKLMPKISDFGLAKVLKEEYIAKFVVGCKGYIDPAFMNTGVLTQKSDIYSFGAVLLELITRKKIVYGEDSSLVVEFRSVYEKEKSGRAMFDKEIEAEEDILVLEEIGKLALECLKDVKDRPDMTEVVEQLLMLRRDNRKFAKEQNTSPRHIVDTGISMEDSPNN